jgi:hypothetical protein
MTFARFAALFATSCALAGCSTPAVLRAPIAAPDFAPPPAGTTPLPRIMERTGDAPIRLPDPQPLPPPGVADPAAGISPADRAAVRRLAPEAFEPVVPAARRGGARPRTREEEGFLPLEGPGLQPPPRPAPLQPPFIPAPPTPRQMQGN